MPRRDPTSQIDVTSSRRHAGVLLPGHLGRSNYLLNPAAEGGILTGMSAPSRLRDRLALRTLLVPGAIGSTHSEMIVGKGVGGARLERPADTARPSRRPSARRAGWR